MATDKINVENIPKELRQLDQWVCWSIEEDKGGKPTKVPKIPGTENENATTANPETWKDFLSAFQWHSAGNYDGIGFVFSENDPYCGIDLDGCRNDQASSVESWASEIVEKFKSYTEISPSGSGLHIICKGKLPGAGRKRKIQGTDHKVEIYDKGRFFTFTGRKSRLSGDEIRDCSTEVIELYHSLESTDKEGKPKKPRQIRQVSPVVPDEEIIEAASKAKNGDKFQRLMAGDWSEYPSESEADGALVMVIGFYTQNHDQIVSIVKRSGLWDKKWEREDYQERTINSALEKMTEFWGQSTATVGAATIQVEEKEAPVIVEPESAPEPFGFPEFNIEKLMPPDGFLKDYLNYMLPMTEAPPSFHLFSGLVALATVIGPRVYFTIADEQKYCNLWVVLTGPSGCKKSTSINKPRRMLASCDFKKYIFPVQITSERLIPMLSENAKEHQGTAIGSFFWPEWGATLDQWGKAYAQDTMSIFTSLYDGGYFSRWLKAEKYEIENSCINLLCGCTLSWLKKTIKQGDISMGFWPRFLFVPTMKRDKYLANPPKGDQELKDRIEAQLKFMRDAFLIEYQQEADFQNVQDAYKSWYDKRNMEADTSASESDFASFMVRISDYALKIAILVETSRKGDWTDISVRIQPDTMEYSLRLCDWLIDTSHYILGTIRQDEMAELQEKLFNMIKESGTDGILHSDVRRTLSWHTKAQIEIAVESLADAERITILQVNREGRGRPGKRYIYGTIKEPN